MKLHILSDLHLDLAANIEIIDNDADIVILAGDIGSGFDSLHWAIRTFTKPTLLVLGNHEIVAGNIQKLSKFREMANNTNVTILENDKLSFKGIRFLGCTLWSPINQKMCVVMNQSIMWLTNMLSTPYPGKTVVITHYSPLRQSLDSHTLLDADLSKRLSVDLQHLIKTSEIHLWIHGHIHKRQDYIFADTRILCNPRGYADMTEAFFNPCLIVEI